MQGIKNYVDRYDLSTIHICLETVNIFKKVEQKALKDKKIDLPPEKVSHDVNLMLNERLLPIMAKRYQEKEKRIIEQMTEDKNKDDLLSNASIPSTCKCEKCGGKLIEETRQLDHRESSNLVLFIAECEKCKSRLGIYNDGTKYIPTKDYCPKCKEEIHASVKFNKNITTWTRECKNCGFKEIDKHDYNKFKQEQLQKEKEDAELLKEYRSKFCYDKEKGDEMVDILEQFKYANEVYKFEMQKYDEPAYVSTAKIKMLKINEIAKQLDKVLKAQGFKNLTLGKPEISDQVIVPFTIEDIINRRNSQSEKELTKLLKQALESTNWRLVSNTIQYRLGYLTGRLKGYERQDDLTALYKTTPQSVTKPLDPAKEEKYGLSSPVQLARIFASVAGREKIREMRLKDEPKGFLLNDEPDRQYTCSICNTSMHGNEAWWDLNGVKCLNCQRNVEKKNIPAEIAKNHDLWFSYSDLDWSFGIKGPTARKMFRLGELNGIELKDSDGKVYHTVFLVAENGEFLKKHKTTRSFHNNWYFFDDEGKKVWL